MTSTFMNTAPEGFALSAKLPEGFLSFYGKLHTKFYPWQQALLLQRQQQLRRALEGELPDYASLGEIELGDWKINLPEWISDQRNQMTGPADDAALVVKMLNSGAPGVMLDLEDSMANTWENLMSGHNNCLQALYGELRFWDEKKQAEIGIQDSKTICLVRVRGLHIHQEGIINNEASSASLFDVALLVYSADISRLKHPLCFYIPKSEHSEEAKWWSALLKEMAIYKGLPEDSIKCMALVESHPIAYQLDAFIYHLKDHLIGLNLGRWDYMASLIHFNLNNPAWVLPDRNTIPGDIAFFQNLRSLIPATCHRRGIFAIGGMTALFPDRNNTERNAQALANLERDKKNEANFGFDGAWTGHPDQNTIAMAQFPAPNQLQEHSKEPMNRPDLRPSIGKAGSYTVQGSFDAARVAILYRYGVLNGKGASLIDGYMEDLATDRIYRLMLSQRCLHYAQRQILTNSGRPVIHDSTFLSHLFEQALAAICKDIEDPDTLALYREARRQSEAMIVEGRHDPV